MKRRLRERKGTQGEEYERVTGPDIPSPGLYRKAFGSQVLSTQWIHGRSYQQAGVTTRSHHME